jgi:hypothetical protein
MYAQQTGGNAAHQIFIPIFLAACLNAIGLATILAGLLVSKRSLPSPLA